MEFAHTSVLLEETIEGLAIKPDGIYVDGTLGGAGHSSHIAARLRTGRLIGIEPGNYRNAEPVAGVRGEAQAGGCAKAAGAVAEGDVDGAALAVVVGHADHDVGDAVGVQVAGDRVVRIAAGGGDAGGSRQVKHGHRETDGGCDDQGTTNAGHLGLLLGD